MNMTMTSLVVEMNTKRWFERAKAVRLTIVIGVEMLVE